MFPIRNSNEYNLKENNTYFNEEPAEVIDIILDETHPAYVNETDIGKIKAKLILGEKTGQFSYVYAYPLRPNLRYIPLIKEIVLIKKSIAASADTTLGACRYYYDIVTNIHDLVNNNILPNSSTTFEDSDENKKYDEFTGNKINKYKQQEESTGRYFIQNDFVPHIKPYEGDFILEGRSGISFRFTQSNNKHGFWKNTNDGSPILIIRTDKNTTEKSKYVTESYNNDNGTIILSTDQIIEDKDIDNIKYTTIAKSEISSKHKDSKCIINYDRIIFKSKKDDIINCSKNNFLVISKGINLSTSKYEINAEETVFNKGQNGGLVKANAIVQELNIALTRINSLIVALQGMATGFSNSGAAPVLGTTLGLALTGAISTFISNPLSPVLSINVSNNQVKH